MSCSRCILCNVVAPLVDRLCSRCIDVVEDYLDAQAENLVDDSDYVPGEPDSQDSDVTVDLDYDADLDEDLDEDPIVDHVPDASPCLERKPPSPK